MRRPINKISKRGFSLRTLQPGDMGWIIFRHGVLYAKELGWDETFEGQVAEIAAAFLRHHDPNRERVWIAERNGERVGSIVLVQKSKTVGQLRLLIVESSARGLGIGKSLVTECIRFAKEVSYRRVVLETNKRLDAARGIYRACGFKPSDRKPLPSRHHQGADECWELRLPAD